MNYVKLIAPAKINLVLAVGEKLPDGYHKAHTILHAIALHDTLEIRRLPADPETGLSVSISCQTTDAIDDLVIAPEDNIVYKATIALAEALGRAEDEQIDIVLSKQIPYEAGLGGGSSDAAATLIGLSQLWEIDPRSPQVIEIAKQLGADVAFFLYGGCAYLDGKGEQFVHALEPRKGFLTLIRAQGAGISTKEAYERFDEAPDYPTADYLEQIASYTKASEVEPWNNLTAAALCVKPSLQDTFALIENAPEANSYVLCGSGSAVAAFCDSYEEASKLSLEARRRGFYSRVTSFASLGAEVLKQY